MKRPPLIVEIVGPAGAGKTTLLRALTQRNKRGSLGIAVIPGLPGRFYRHIWRLFARQCPYMATNIGSPRQLPENHKRIVVGARPRVRRIEHIPFFVRNALLLLPTFLHLYQDSCRWLTRREIEWMVILKGWHHILGRRASNNGSVTILDQGPVFMLAMLHVFGPESLNSQSVETWWDSTYNQWASTLDVVIWLDAPDAILLERIHARNKWHLVKEESEQEAYKFLACFRTSYEQIIAKLTANCGPRVLRFDTKQESLDQIVDKVLAAFDLEHSEG